MLATAGILTCGVLLLALQGAFRRTERAVSGLFGAGAERTPHQSTSFVRRSDVALEFCNLLFAVDEARLLGRPVERVLVVEVMVAVSHGNPQKEEKW